jgi:1-pyrroline-5-carboxylate dehydrogenase
MKAELPFEVPCVINGKPVRSLQFYHCMHHSHRSDVQVKTGKLHKQPLPASHAHHLCTYHEADAALTRQAIEDALAAKEEWENMPWHDRAAIFLKAADLISSKYRYEIMAATILGQGKNAWQAEIDAAAEVCLSLSCPSSSKCRRPKRASTGAPPTAILPLLPTCLIRLLTRLLQLSDFFRFGVKCVEELYSQQPPENAQYSWNRLEYRPLEGFVLAVSPFNFTAIGGNLAGAPALVGNVVVWKPSSAATYSNYLIHRILLEAGLPPSVIQFVPGPPDQVVTTALGHRDFAGLHFTGSTKVFKGLWKEIGDNVGQGVYKSYPRVVGETGGKNWHLVHQSADVQNAVLQSVRSAFEYQG